MNFKKATPVQEQAIPVILDKKDVIACAQTGTGKTAAFLLPLLDNLKNDNHDVNKVNSIIMAPTRELAQQIDQMMEGFSYFTPFSSVAVYGGNDAEAWDVQKRGLLSGADVVIATPGRLLSHINLYNIDFSGVKYFILDEADRMLDMGFYDDIMKIEKLLPKERQTIMFSATMPPKIQQLAKTILRDPKEITIAIARPPETILQSAYICHEAQKIGIVKQLFKEKKPNKVLLFSGSKMKVKEITKVLRRMGINADEMHSDLDQSQREHVMHEFRNERVNILVATDIVARGIDIDDISLVINFDVPYDAEDYVHRIGRTARAGDSGMAITFVSPDEQYRFSLIEKFLEKKIYQIPVPAELGEAPEYNPVRDRRRRGAAIRSKSTGRKGKGRAAERTEGLERKERPERGERTGQGKRDRQGERAGQGKRQKRKKREGTENPERRDNKQGVERAVKGDPTKQERPRQEQPKRQRPEQESQTRDRARQRQQRQGQPRQERQKQQRPKQEQPQQGTQTEERPKKKRSGQEQSKRKQTGQERSRREQGGQERAKQNQPRQERQREEQRQDQPRQERQREGQRQRQKQRQGQTREERSRQERPRKEKTGQEQPKGSKKDQRSREHERSKTPDKPRSSKGQQTQQGQRERNDNDKALARETKKAKKWSWWPFGKK